VPTARRAPAIRLVDQRGPTIAIHGRASARLRGGLLLGSRSTVPNRNRKNPSSLVFWNDLRHDTQLRRCSPAAKGLWAVHFLPCAAESPEFGVVIVDNLPSRREDLGALFCREFGETAEATQALVDELVKFGAGKIDNQGRVYCKRMVREEAARRAKSDAGKAGADARWNKGGDGTPHGRDDASGDGRGGGMLDGRNDVGEAPLCADGSRINGDGRQFDEWQNSSAADANENGRLMHSSSFLLQASERTDGESLIEPSSAPFGAGDDADVRPALPMTGGDATSLEQQAFDAWLSAARRHEWPKPRELDPDRRKALQGRIRDAGSLAQFLEVLAMAERSRFLREEMKGWSLDWFLKPANFRKVSEGNYVGDRAPAPRRQGGTEAFARGAMSGASKPVSGILNR
jgi:hypothetical protein